MKWPLNRVVIEKNSIKQLVYYWFDERGRKIANEYLAKWYLHADAVVMNRTDGALVRLVTQIRDGETEYDADRRLRAFMRDAMPTLSEYLPSEVLHLRSNQAVSGSKSNSTRSERQCRSYINGNLPKHALLVGLAILGSCRRSFFWFSERGSPDDQARSYYEHGVKLAEQHDYAKAAIELRNALRLQKQYAGGVARPCQDRRGHSTLG